MLTVLEQNVPLLGSQTPRIERTTPFVSNDAKYAIELAASYGLELDPWQQHILHGALGVTETSNWAARTVGFTVARQQGKSALFEARELAGLLLFNERLIIYSAHEVKAFLLHFERMRSYFENYDDLRKMVKSMPMQRGMEGIILKNGCQIRFMSRSKNSGKGFTADTLLMDEAQVIKPEAYSAIIPTTLARPNPQVWLGGTAPDFDYEGQTFINLRNTALEGKQDRLYWAEWSADPDLDYDDRTGWSQALPALGKRGVDLESVEDARAALSDEGFAREMLNIWGGSTKKQVIPRDLWALRAAPSGLSEESTELALAVDVAPNRETASVALAGVRPDGKHQVEVLRNLNGVGWAVDYIAEVCGRRSIRAVVIDAIGPASSLIEPLKAKGVPVRVLTGREVTGASGTFYDAAMENTITHLDDPVLNTALGAARKRTVGDSWAWHRRDNTDITPLVACTFANYGLSVSMDTATPAKRKTPSVSTTYYAFN